MTTDQWRGPVRNLKDLDAALAKVDFVGMKSMHMGGMLYPALNRLLAAGYAGTAIDELLLKHFVKKPGNLRQFLKRGKASYETRFNCDEHALEHAAGFMS